jgi:AcrR family transcriptional regulator
MPRAGLSTARVVEEAGLLADENGSPAVSLATLANRLGVQVPSLYKHVAGADDLHRLMAIGARIEFGDALLRAAVGRSREEAVAALALAYRDWAVAHPGRYPMTLRAPKLDDVDDMEASTRAVGVIFDALAGYGLDGDDAVDATRQLRSLLHGFVSLVAAGAFELPDLDRSFDRMIASAQLWLSEWSSVVG